MFNSIFSNINKIGRDKFELYFKTIIICNYQYFISNRNCFKIYINTIHFDIYNNLCKQKLFNTLLMYVCIIDISESYISLYFYKLFCMYMSTKLCTILNYNTHFYLYCNSAIVSKFDQLPKEFDCFYPKKVYYTFSFLNMKYYFHFCLFLYQLPIKIKKSHYL